MEATVNDFLNEINQMSSKKDPEVWQECFDELTGYSYFWNVETDEVTWVPPKSYKPADNSSRKPNFKGTNLDREKKRADLYIPPNATQYSAKDIKPEAKTKVYSIQDVIKKSKVPKEKFEASNRSNQTHKMNKSFKKDDDSDDEKIELITEYGGESDSEVKEPKVKSLPKTVPCKMETSVLKKLDNQVENEDEEEEDDVDLLVKIQQRAQELKKLGGKVPSEVKNIIQDSEASKPVSGFSLVAGYNSDSSDNESDNEKEEILPPQKPLFPVAPPLEPTSGTSHSTLFPITKPINVNDFIEPITSNATNDEVKPSEKNNIINNDFDNKQFQRKRRIGVCLLNSSVKKAKETIEQPDSEFAGLGFKAENDNIEKKDASNIYQGFQKGGVMFVKSDVLQPSSESKPEETLAKEGEILDKKETENDYTMLKEKLCFLGEGREPVLPVQAMLIQAQTLFLAMNEGGLKLAYLHKWLKETCSELIKLEKEAAPDGWLLQWDRSHKRYFYQNRTTGMSQWRYPEPDVMRCDDAMDISTTPPPQDPAEVTFGPHLPPAEPPLPPSPPKIKCPTPPPPPLIGITTTNMIDVPLPPEQGPVEDRESPLDNVNSKQENQKVSDTLSSALDSFYSEIAEVSEKCVSPVPVPAVETPAAEVPSTPEPVSLSNEVPKKKKKKVKLAPGLSMKKKGVSQMVEKWKNVQKSYED